MAMQSKRKAADPAKNWFDFLDWASKRVPSDRVFRGHPDSAYKLTPSIGRAENYSFKREETLFKHFRKRAPSFVDIRSLPDLQLLALAAHHGLPTRLLDWTSNPLVALFFAVHGTASEAGRDGEVIAYKVPPVSLRVAETLDGPFDDTLDQVAFFVPSSVTTRIVSQSGLFSIHPAPQEPWDSEMVEQLERFRIPCDEKQRFQQRLFKLGVDPQFIMGGLDGLAQRLKWQYSRNYGFLIG